MTNTASNSLYVPPVVEPRLTVESTRQGAVERASKNLKLRPVSHEIRDRLPQLNSKDPEERKAGHEWLLGQDRKLLEACETESHVALMECFDHRYHEMAVELTERIIEEEGCSTALEKMQVEMAVLHFIRGLAATRKFRETQDDYIGTKEKAVMLKELSKQQDQSHRLFLASIGTLRQWKMPHVSLNINTGAAFVAQNIRQ